MRQFFWNILLAFLFSCSGKKYSVTDTYVYNSNGFTEGLTFPYCQFIVMIKINYLKKIKIQ